MPLHLARPVPDLPDLAELLRQSLAGFAPNDLLAAMLDRMEGRP
ncbi:MAG: hypothetical protein U0934_06730 [Pseudotabrizicola sp.]|nr:hypothetical protein [Pseudotabrizicola sp.]MDO8883986.1 hypothetical protein [Pseudotabrizicola sp.]MDP2081002.1 hypothetical protein [Pseudotabrizicola sp.]MDZ7573634.1 hypothetical protein [Pseudotabrizicola sp.]